MWIGREMSQSQELECLKINDPMKNDLVLQNIFNFCDVASLKNIRLVSSKWRDLSLKAWRSKAMIRLSNYDGANLDFGQFLKMIDSEDSSEFKLSKHPFKRYSVKFEDWWLDEAVYWEQKRVGVAIFNGQARHVKILWDSDLFEGLNEFLSILNSDFLQSLEVVWHTFGQAIPDTLQTLNYSNLKKLKLLATTLHGHHSPAYSLWGYLLKCFPKLEALSVGYKIEEGSEEVTYPICLNDRLEIANMLKRLKISEPEGGTKLPLKELEMMDVYTQQNIYSYKRKEYEIICALAECNFPLERLNIQVGWHGGEGDQIPIMPLLRSCKDTLQYLKTSINFNSALFANDEFEDFITRREADGEVEIESELKPSKSPKISMEALKEVRLLNGLEWAMYLLAHLRVPQLEKLVVEYEKARNPYPNDRRGLVAVTLPNGGKFKFLKLETFELHDNPIIPPPKMCRMFARMMPNLVRLTIPLDKRSFPVICQHFKGLRTLHILGAQSDYVEVDDEALTGISKAQLKSEDGSVPPRKPNITDLEHLSDLRICCQRQLRRDDVKFTEHSVMYGFLQLPKLYNLSVAFKELSEEVKKQLVTHVKGNVDLQTKINTPLNCFSIRFISPDYSSDSDGDGGGQ